MSSEEKIYYVERFNRGVVAFDHLEMADTIGEGIPYVRVRIMYIAGLYINIIYIGKLI